MASALDGSTQRIALSVIVPVYNEAGTLVPYMRDLVRILDALPDAPAWELLLVDDGSNDGSLGAAMRLASEERRIALCIHDRPYGVGRAMSTGCAHARGDYAIVLDADLSYGLSTIAELWTSAFTSGADIVIASTCMRGGGLRNVPPLSRWLIASANWFLSRASGGRVRTLTGVMRLYRMSLLRDMIDGVQADAMLPDLLFEALQRGAHIKEVPATLAWRPEPRGGCPCIRQSAAGKVLAIVRCGLRRRPALPLRDRLRDPQTA